MISMKFHGTIGVSEIGKSKFRSDSIELYVISSFSFSMTPMFPWNSIER